MIDEKELRLWISRLETEESSWPNYEKLAILYIIQQRQNQKEEKQDVADQYAQPVMYSAAAADPVTVYGDSDFLQAVSRIAPEKAWGIIDELMDSLKIINERVYNNVMRKLEA